jgi:hypothetical protein
MMNLVTKSVKVTSGISGLNLSKEAHENINEVRRLLTEKEVEIEGVKNNKKELFEFAAAELLSAIREKLGIKVEVVSVEKLSLDDDNTLESEEN